MILASVITYEYEIWTKSPRCDRITCAVDSYVANLGELINVHLIALSSKRLHKLKAVFRYTKAVSNTIRSLLYVVELIYFIRNMK